jgi:hypothetical protein
MENDEVEIWCHIEGMADYTCISIPRTQSVIHLKKLILAEHRQFFTGYGRGDLILIKVSHIMISM